MKKNDCTLYMVFVIIFFVLLGVKPLTAQISVENYTALSNAQVAQALVDSLMGNGVTFSNASFQGVRSSSSSYGYQSCYFTTTGTTQTQMGIARGVALTSGNTNLISIPIGQNPAASNSFSKGYISSAPGELRKSTSPINDLTVLAGPVNWFNASILEFDFVPSGDSIEFNYVFGSEEYSDNTNFTNYQCTEYNDKFGFLISGPGIAGNAGYDNNARNIARLTNGSEVGINSVNNGTVGSSASPNGPSYCQNTNPAWTLNTPVNEYYGPIQGTSPNGNTKVLKAVQGGLTPGATYHIRLLILDAKDGAYDAIVYIEAGSFSSPQPGLSLSANPSTLCQGTSTYVVANQSNGTAPFNYTWSNGIVHNTSSTKDSILVSPSVTTTYSLTVTDALSQTASASIVIIVSPNPSPVAGSNSPICQGSNLNLTVNTGTSWNWSGPNGFTSTVQNPVIIAAPTAASGIYTVIVTNAQGCTATTTVVATVNLAPVPVAGSNSPICQGSNLNLNVNTGTSWTWSGPNSFSSTSQNPILTAATTAASGTYTVAVTNDQGCSASTTVQVTVNTYLTPAASTNSPVCHGGNLNLSVNTGTTWNWTGPNGFNSTQQNPVINNVSTAATGTYTVQVSNAQGCTGTASVNAIVNTNPQPLAGSNSPVCQNNTLSLNVNTGTSWSWSGPNGFSSTTQNPSIPNATPAASGTYTVTVNNSQGCTASSSVQVTINNAPAVNPVTNSPICQNASLTLGVNSGISWNWTGPNGFTSTVQNPTLAIATAAASGTYAVLVSDAQGCTASASVNATVNANPLPVCNSNAPICESGTLNLSVNTGTSWNWSGPNSFTSTLQNPSVNNITPASNGTYTVTVSDTQGCSGTTSVNVLVNANPQPIAGSNSPICQNNTLSLNVNTGTSWNWSGPNGFNSTAQNPSIPNVTTTAIGIYTVTVTDANACSGTASVNVNINQGPVLLVTTSPSGICYGNQTTISITGASSYIWNTGDTASSFTETPLSNSTYTVTGTDNQGCSSVSQASVTVNPLPVISITPSQAAVCEGSSVTLTATSNTTATQFEWNNAATGVSITVSPATNTSYSVIVTDANGCTGQASTAVTVNPIPSVDFDADPLNGCAPLNVSFSSLSSSQNTHQWTFGDNSSASLINPGHLYLNAGMYSISLTVTSPAGCSNSLTKLNFIEVYPVPIASFYTNSSLTDMLESEIYFTNQSSGAVSWEWDFGDGSDSSSTAENPVFTYSQDGSFTVWLFVESFHGCTDSTSREVIIKPLTTFYVPSAFTPNADGINDFFGPIGVGIDLNDYEMYIYDRWGKLIFKSADINNMWDGKVLGTGNPAGQDVYSWVIFFNKPDKHERYLNRYIGSVTLLR